MTVAPEKFLEAIHQGRLHIEARDGSATTYKRYPWQEKADARWRQNRMRGHFTYEIWLKGRQPGATTGAICGNIADAMTRRVKSLIVATSDDMVDLVWDKAKLACFGPDLSEAESLDDDEQEDEPGPKKKQKKPRVNSKRFIVPGTGSVVRIRNERGVAAKGAQKKVARGGTFQTALFTEIDLWKDFGRTYDALYPAIATVDPYGRLIMESTLEPGGSAEYRQFIKKALDNPHGQWKVAFTPWYEVPEYRARPTDAQAREIGLTLSSRESALMVAGATIQNLHWRRQQIDAMGDEERFDRIHPPDAQACLDASSGNLFDGATHDWLNDGIRPPIKERWVGPHGSSTAMLDTRPSERPDDEPLAQLWVMPGHNKHYTMGIDTADSSQSANRGSESALVVTDNETGDQVAEWHGFVDPHVCAAAAVAVARFYNNARVVIEIDAAGKAVLGFMRQLHRYDNFFMRESIDRRTKTPVSLIGFDARETSNARLMSVFVQLIKNRQVKNYSETLTEQVISLSARGGEWNHKQGQGTGDRGMRDDLARAWALSMVGCDRRDMWQSQFERVKYDGYVLLDERRGGFTWGDVEKSLGEVDENASYPGLIRV